MTNQQCYEAKLALFEQMPASAAMSPTVPVDKEVQEAENTLTWCQPDKARLIAGGLDWTLVEDLPVRAAALRHAESLWFATRFTNEEAEQLWNVKSPGGFDLRNEILHHALRGYRKHPDLLARVQKVAEGSGNDDMIQDLSDLAVLCKANPEPLKTINFDMTTIDLAIDFSSSLGALLAAATTDRQAQDKARVIRDKAYAHLKEALDEIREAGQYVFYREPERLKGYASEYNRRRNNSKAQTKSPVAI
jgi:hypothetical protein